MHRDMAHQASSRLGPATYLLQMASTLITEPRTRRAEMVTMVTTTAGLWSLDPEAAGRETTRLREAEDQAPREAPGQTPVLTPQQDSHSTSALGLASRRQGTKAAPPATVAPGASSFPRARHFHCSPALRERSRHPDRQAQASLCAFLMHSEGSSAGGWPLVQAPQPQSRTVTSNNDELTFNAHLLHSRLSDPRQ